MRRDESQDPDALRRGAMLRPDGADDHAEIAHHAQTLRNQLFGRFIRRDGSIRSVYRSFHVVYNVECSSEDDQAKVGRALELTHEKYCGMVQMLRRIAPVSREIAVVSTQPAKA